MNIEIFCRKKNFPCVGVLNSLNLSVYPPYGVQQTASFMMYCVVY